MRRCPHREVRRPTSRDGERGFALLMIFLMAAIVAIMLYQQLPRVAFESEREREQLLIDRGEEYVRAIQLYVTDNGRYPQSIDDLEDTNNKRYLRRRYLDPYTGEDEWRLIHTNGQYLTDSLVEKPPDINGEDDETQDALNGQGQPDQVNVAVLERPSDRTLPNSGNFNQPQPGGTPATGPPYELFPGQSPRTGELTDDGQVIGPDGNPFTPEWPGQQFAGQQFPGQPYPGTQNNGNNNGGNNNGGNNGFQPQFPGQPSPGGQPNPVGFFPASQGVRVGTNGAAPGGVPLGFQVGPNGQLVAIPGQVPQIPPGFRLDANGQLVAANGGGQVRIGPNGQVVATNGAGQPIIDQPGRGGPTPGQPVSNFNQILANFNANNNNNANSGQNPNTSNPTPPAPQTAGGQRIFQGQAPNRPGVPNQPGVPGGDGNNAALNLINQLLTTPRQPPAGVGNQQGNSFGGGIAGVASTHTGPSIKIYRERSKYEEWEFVFDAQSAGLALGQTGASGPNTGQNNQNGGQNGPNGRGPGGTNGPGGLGGLPGGPGRGPGGPGRGTPPGGGFPGGGFPGGGFPGGGLPGGPGGVPVGGPGGR